MKIDFWIDKNAEKKYEMTITTERTLMVEVEAKDEDEAVEKVEDRANWIDEYEVEEKVKEIYDIEEAKK